MTFTIIGLLQLTISTLQFLVYYYIPHIWYWKWRKSVEKLLGNKYEVNWGFQGQHTNMYFEKINVHTKWTSLTWKRVKWKELFVVKSIHPILIVTLKEWLSIVSKYSNLSGRFKISWLIQNLVIYSYFQKMRGI